MEEVHLLNTAIPPEQAVLLLERAFARRMEGNGREDVQGYELCELLQNLQQQADTFKGEKQGEREELEEDGKQILSEYTSVSTMVQTMEDRVQELQFALQTCQKDLDDQRQRAEDFQHRRHFIEISANIP